MPTGGRTDWTLQVHRQPLQTSDKTEQLRAYHARLDIMNEAYQPDPTQNDWKAELIEKFVHRKNSDESTDLAFKIHWHGGTKAWMKMDAMRLHDPYMVIRYGVRNKLTNKPGWEWVKSYMDTDELMNKMVSTYKVSAEKTYKFGIYVPKNTKEARRVDVADNNTLWDTSILTELKQINDYETFIVLEDNEAMPTGYKRIPYHCIYDVKFDGRRKCRLVAGGHRTDPPKEDTFSGVVSMEAVRLGFIMARLNNLQVCAGDVGNAFLYGKTREKVFVIAGEEFGKDAGKRMIIYHSLYGLKSSSARFHEHLSIHL